MSAHAILTAIGSDRPGIVDEVSQFIFDHGGNIEDSRMVNLRGHFAMMLLIGGSGDVLERLQGEMAELRRRTGLHADLRPADTERSRRAGDAMPYRLKGTGIDQAGLVHRVAHLLREMNVNIESLDTQLKPAPYTGAPMFEIELVMAVPKATPVSEMRQRLGRLCDDLNIDWELEAM